jgi:hypothetical protein
MPITDPQGAALAQILHQIRRDWPMPSLIAHLKSHADHPAPFGDIAQAAITTANERDAKTPLLIWDQGSHWPERIRERLPAGPRCEDHTTEPAATCRSCRGDVLAGERTEAQIGKRLNPAPPVPASQASRARGQA